MKHKSQQIFRQVMDNTYKFSTKSEVRQQAIVLTLRKHGFQAYMETNPTVLRTSASLAIVALCVGNGLEVRPLEVTNAIN